MSRVYKIVRKKWQEEILKKLMSLPDEDIDYISKKRLIFETDLEPPLTEEEKLWICDGITFKYPKNKILQELEKLRK